MIICISYIIYYTTEECQVSQHLLDSPSEGGTILLMAEISVGQKHTADVSLQLDFPLYFKDTIVYPYSATPTKLGS